MLGGGARTGKILAIASGAVGTVGGFGLCHLGHHLLDNPVVLPTGVPVNGAPFFVRNSSFKFLDYVFSSRHEYSFTRDRPKDMEQTDFSDPGPFVPPNIMESAIFCDIFYILAVVFFIIIFIVLLIRR
jgi:hypothetical protein